MGAEQSGLKWDVLPWAKISETKLKEFWDNPLLSNLTGIFFNSQKTSDYFMRQILQFLNSDRHAIVHQFVYDEAEFDDYVTPFSDKQAVDIANGVPAFVWFKSSFDVGIGHTTVVVMKRDGPKGKMRYMHIDSSRIPLQANFVDNWLKGIAGNHLKDHGVPFPENIDHGTETCPVWQKVSQCCSSWSMFSGIANAFFDSTSVDAFMSDVEGGRRSYMKFMPWVHFVVMDGQSPYERALITYPDHTFMNTMISQLVGDKSIGMARAFLRAHFHSGSGGDFLPFLFIFCELSDQDPYQNLIQYSIGHLELIYGSDVTDKQDCEKSEKCREVCFDKEISVCLEKWVLRRTYQEWYLTLPKSGEEGYYQKTAAAMRPYFFEFAPRLLRALDKLKKYNQ